MTGNGLSPLAGPGCPNAAYSFRLQSLKLVYRRKCCEQKPSLLRTYPSHALLIATNNFSSSSTKGRTPPLLSCFNHLSSLHHARCSDPARGNKRQPRKKESNSGTRTLLHHCSWLLPKQSETRRAKGGRLSYSTDGEVPRFYVCSRCQRRLIATVRRFFLVDRARGIPQTPPHDEDTLT